MSDELVKHLEANIELLQERLVDLQREDAGWALLSKDRTFSDPAALRRNADLVRIMSIMNPLMKRAKEARIGYVFGDGVEVTVREDQDGQDANAVAQAFMTDEGNLAAVFGEQALSALEGDMFDDGNAFIAHFTNPLTGEVKVRPLPFDEITEIRTKPGDKYSTTFYKRSWTEANGTATVTKSALYPDIHYQPAARLRVIDGNEVKWDAPVYHLKVNPAGRDRLWGVGDGFSAMPWARAYKDFLEDWALYMRAVSKIAWMLRDPNAKSQQLRAMANGIAGGQAGGVAYSNSGELKAPSVGATLDSESGLPLAAMVSSATGIPVTILTGNPGTTGARAVAETLDKPLVRMIGLRRGVYREFLQASIGYVLEAAVVAPRGPLKGTWTRVDDRLRVKLSGDQEATVEVAFPPLDELDPKTVVEAIQLASDMDLLPPLVKLKAVAQALRLPDLADLIDQVTDDDGNFIPPSTQLDNVLGQQAADALRAGESINL